MACLDENTILDLARGALAGDAKERAHEHLASCVECRRLVSDLAQDMPTPLIDASPDSILTESARPPGAGPPGPRVATLAAGEVLGRYVVLGMIGAGGMSLVYAAYDPELDRKVALKLLIRRRGRSQEHAVRLLREAQALAKLSHPNIVAIHDTGVIDGEVFLAMEFVEGETLRTWRAGKHDWRERLGVLEQAGQGLRAAHQLGMIHRDFKPDNVSIGRDGRVRVLDFGLARMSGFLRQRVGFDLARADG